MKKKQNGSFTIEASFVVPIVLMVFMASVYIIFYFHDKNILSGAVYETAVVGSGRKGYEKEELEAYFRRRIKGKLTWIIHGVAVKVAESYIVTVF